MDYGIGFVLGGLACGFLWALRELERRQAFENLAEEIETLRKQNQKYKNLCGFARDGFRDIRIGLGGNGSLPAPAENAGQHFARVTTRLKGNSGPSAGGPICRGRWQ